jgi:hypothetical protein
MIKRIYYFVICLLPGFVLASLIVGGILMKLGWVAEQLRNRVSWCITPFTTAAVFYAFFVYDYRSKEEIAAAKKEERRQRSRYREDL